MELCFQEDNKKDTSNIKIMKCNKCNTIPYIKFFKKKYSSTLSTKIFVKCKCMKLETMNFDDLNIFYSTIERIPQNEKKIKSNIFLNENNYKIIKEAFEKAKEKIYIKLKEIKEETIKYFYKKINKIEELYKENKKLNKKILDTIEILMNTYENYSPKNENELKTLSNNIIINTNFNLSLKNQLENNEYFFEKRIIFVNEEKYNLEHIKTIDLKVDLYDIYKLMPLSNDKIFLIYKQDNPQNQICFLCLNPKNNFKIEYKKKIDNFLDCQYYEGFFEIEEEKIFFYNNKKTNYFILNLKTLELNKFIFNYKKYIKLKNGNILGLKDEKIAIINQNGKELLSKSNISQYIFKYGIMLSNGALFFIKEKNQEIRNSQLVLFDSNKLFEIKRKVFENFIIDKIYNDNIKNKKILLLDEHNKILVVNYELIIEIIIGNSYIPYKIFFNKNYYFYFCFSNGQCFFMDSRKYKSVTYHIPYLIDSNEKIFISKRREYYIDNINYNSLCFFGKKYLIIYNNYELLIYEFPKKIDY